MTPATMRETLKRELDRWPDELVEYVFDFVQFVTGDEQAEETFLWQKVKEAHAYDQQHPEDVTTVTAEVWDRMFQHETDPAS
jgi:hemerythrin superfamily protein